MAPIGKHKKRIKSELQENQAWRVEAAGAWVCPFCGEAVVRAADAGERPDEASLARAVQHLERCRRWEGGDGELLPLAELQARQAALRFREHVRKSLLERAGWQVYDVARRWYCPFCAQATPVVVPEGGRVSTAHLREIERHIAGCEGFARGRGPEKPLAYLQSMVAYANRTRKMAEQVRRKVEADAAWRLRDVLGRWVCPYCRKVQEHIDFSTSVQMVETAPLEIARHLFGSCERFREHQSGGGAAAAQSSVSLEIARLGAAPSNDLVRLSGSPPAAVSGEFGTVRPEDAAALLEGRPLSTERALGDGGADHGSEPSDDEHPLASAPAPARDAKERKDVREAREPKEHREPRAPRDPREHRDHRGALASTGAGKRGEIEAKISAVRSLAEPDSRASGRHQPEQPSLPEVEGLEIRSFFRGAHAHPLDFAEVAPLEGRRVALIVGGVSGEGAETGLILPMVRNLFRMHAKKARAPGDVLRRVNADLFAELDGKTFVAALYGIFDTAARTYRFARAGTEPPILYRPGGDPELEVLESPGMVLGIDRGPVFEASVVEREIALYPEDMLVQFTHGTVAAEDVDGREIGGERFRDMLRRYGRHEADYLTAKIAGYFEDWTRGAALSEDACVLAVKLKP